jgi:beta-glucanase (GH16 family)
LLLFFSTPLLALEDYILPSGEWRQISLPLDPGKNKTVSAIFEDDIQAAKAGAEYGTDWVVYSYDSAEGRYDRKELEHDLQQGVGYWITQITGSEATLKMPVGSVAGFDPFSIPVVPPAEGGSTRWNMLGHPLEASVKFSDYRIKTSSGGCIGQGCDPTKAEEETVLHNEIWRYKDGAYQKASGDDELNPWDGFWCAALTGSADTSPQLFVASTPFHPPIAGNWNLNFKEEFEVDSLDPNKWRLGQHYLGIAGEAGNSAEQIKVNGGSLHLMAKKKPIKFVGNDGVYKDFAYVSGEVTTFQKFRQLYGYFEARIKYDANHGVWPAFWTMPDRGNYGAENQARESFMRFNLSSISQPVTTALLKLKVTDLALKVYTAEQSDGAIDLVNVTVHPLLSTDWNEMSINWNNKPAYDPVWLQQIIRKNLPTSSDASNEVLATSTSQEDPGFTMEEFFEEQRDSHKDSTFSQETSTQANGISSAETIQSPEEFTVGEELVIDVTDFVSRQIQAGENAAGFALVDTFLRHNQVSFGSKENADLENRPQLEINGQILYPEADAYVRAGVHAETNFGEKSELILKDPWKGRISSIADGGMEIDIMESLGSWSNGVLEDQKTQHAVHWDRYGYNHPQDHSGIIDIPPTDDDYHTYGMSWQPGRIDFYIDGIKSGWEYVNERTCSIDSYILLSHQLGGWEEGGEPVNKIPSDFQSATMYVDYVRVWSGSSSP